MKFWPGYLGRQAYEDLLEGDPDVETLRANLLEIIEPHGFRWRVFFVAMSGFLADSYAIFSPNVVSPALAYVYWQNDNHGTKGMVINVITLAGSCIGMVTFGYLADRYGRKRLYGVELVIGIVATLGLTQVSAGFDQKSMNAFAWIVWWRLILGIAIGAEYPLSALIAAEWSATSTRGTMLASVFLMQPVGQFLAYIIGYGALRGIIHDRLPDWTANDWASLDSGTRSEGTAAIDAVWRCVIGVGAFPALLAIVLRWTIPETPRYLIDVKEDLPAAAEATRRIYPKGEDTPSRQNSDPTSRSKNPKLAVNTSTGQSSSNGALNNGLKKRSSASTHQVSADNIEMDALPKTQTTNKTVTKNTELNSKPTTLKSTDVNETDLADQELDRRATESRKIPRKDDFWSAWRTVCKKGNGFTRMLAATSICWFIMDVCFYGLGLDTARTLAKIWGANASDVTANAGTNATAVIFDWNSGFASQDDNIYDALLGDATRALWTIPLSAIPGSVVFLLLVNYIDRVIVLRWTFVALAILFAITGSSLLAVFETNHHSVTIVFYAFALFILNCGPNTILFMLPAELFPTKYRGTCYGIAAASGKAGAIIITLIVHYQKISRPSSGKRKLAIMLMCFVPLMLIGAFVAWVWIPGVQHPRAPKSEEIRKCGERHLMPPRSLEEISADPTEKGPPQLQTFGVNNHLRQLFGLSKTSKASKTDSSNV